MSTHCPVTQDIGDKTTERIAVIPTQFGELRVSVLSGQCVLVAEVYKPTVGPVEREDPGSKLVLSRDDLRSLLRALLTAAPKIGVVCLDDKEV